MTKLPAGALSKVPEVTIGFWVIKVHNERDRSWAPRVIIWASILKSLRQITHNNQGINIASNTT